MANKWYEKSGEQSNVIISTRVRLARNIADFPFPCKLEVTQKKEIAQKIKATIENSGTYMAAQFDFIDMEQIDSTHAQSLTERHLISPEFASNREGRAIMLSKDESVSIMINEEDHVRIQVMCEGLNLEQAYDTADKLDTLMDNELHFAYDEKLGYLTQCPTNLGTGMRASVMLHLPALQSRKAISRLEDNLSKIGLTLRGSYGEGTRAKAAMYQLSNQVTLGLSEDTALDNLKNVAMQIVSQEETARKEAMENIQTLDYIMRAYGTLKYAKLLTSEECINLLSAVRLGVASGVIKDVSMDTVNGLMVDLQAATMSVRENKDLSPDERDIIRAKTVQQKI